MSEISEPPKISESSDAPQEPASDFDPETMRTTKPGLKRLSITLSVLLSFLLGFRFLWKSVEIYRAPLPFYDIDSLSTEIQSNPILFPCQFQVIFINFTSNPNTLKSLILTEITKLTFNKPAQCGTCSNNFTLSVTTDSQTLGSIGAVDFDHDDDESVDEALKSVLGGKVYSVVVVNGGGGGGEEEEQVDVRGVVGKYRHAWISGQGLKEDEVVPRIAEIFVNVFVNGGREEEEGGTIRSEFMPVGSDGRIVLSFNLLNANPNDWVYDWYLIYFLVFYILR